MQSLAGSLVFIKKALYRMYSSLSLAVKPYHYIRVTKTLKQDMQVWLDFLANLHGSTQLSDPDWLDQDTLHLNAQAPWVVVSSLVVIGPTFSVPSTGHQTQEETKPTSS